MNCDFEDFVLNTSPMVEVGKVAICDPFPVSASLQTVFHPNLVEPPTRIEASLVHPGSEQAAKTAFHAYYATKTAKIKLRIRSSAKPNRVSDSYHNMEDGRYACSCREDDSIIPDNLPKGYCGFVVNLWFRNEVERASGDDALVLDSYKKWLRFPNFENMEMILDSCISSCTRVYLPGRLQDSVAEKVLSFANSMLMDTESEYKKVLPIAMEVVVRTLQGSMEREQEAIARAFTEPANAYPDADDANGSCRQLPQDQEHLIKRYAGERWGGEGNAVRIFSVGRHGDQLLVALPVEVEGMGQDDDTQKMAPSYEARKDPTEVGC
ncbi:hypothetical protein RHSIM_Rhsim05G0061300 [Rhododendron simsii]|uniref:Uncharacterized protein n=1 Tax=Rhododendron simsii TaxID=118357 RepID=A0A834GWT9_RHOSS|nr:hypothetical protein RHSIM_Rhsim05G0061300 [Rhododendron simsii]